MCKIINVVLYFNKTFKLLKAHNTPGPVQIRWMLIENKQLLFPCDLFEKSFTHSKIWHIFGWMYPIIWNMYVEYSSLALVILNYQKFAKKGIKFFYYTIDWMPENHFQKRFLHWIPHKLHKSPNDFKFPESVFFGDEFPEVGNPENNVQTLVQLLSNYLTKWQNRVLRCLWFNFNAENS